MNEKDISIINSTSLKININSVKILMIIIYVGGWLFPKVSIGSINLGIQDIACLLLLFNLKISKKYLIIFSAELIYAFVIIFYSIIEVLNYGSLDGMLIAIRIFLFVIAGIAISRYDISIIKKSLQLIIIIYLLYFVYNFGVIILNVSNTGLSLLNFLRGYGDFRIKAPFEGGGTTTVPIGYMLSLLLVFTSLHYGKLVNFFVSLCALGTASRSAILSVFITNGINMNYKKVHAWLLAIPFVVLFVGFIVLKSFDDSGGIDGSSSKRLDLYLYAIKAMWQNPSALLFGFGVGPNAYKLI